MTAASAVHPLRAARESVGLSRPELAHRAGCSPRTIEAIEQGERTASVNLAERFEKALLRAALARVDRIEDAVAAVAKLDAATGRERTGAV